MALLIPVLCTSHEQPTYIPKSQRSPLKQLTDQWGQVLKSWIKKASETTSQLTTAWQRKQVLHRNRAIARKYSAHHIHMQPRAIIALQVLALTATGAR